MLLVPLLCSVTLTVPITAVSVACGQHLFKRGSPAQRDKCVQCAHRPVSGSSHPRSFLEHSRGDDLCSTLARMKHSKAAITVGSTRLKWAGVSEEWGWRAGA